MDVELRALSVTQADREASAELANALGISCEDFTSGAADILVQAFARHRATAEQAGREAERADVVAYVNTIDPDMAERIERGVHLSYFESEADRD